MLIVMDTTNAAATSLSEDWFMLLAVTILAIYLVARFSRSISGENAAISITTDQHRPVLSRNLPARPRPHAETTVSVAARFCNKIGHCSGSAVAVISARGPGAASTAMTGTPSPCRDLPADALKQWQRLCDVINNAGERSRKIGSYQSGAKVQLDAAELALNRMLAEIATIMPLPIAPATAVQEFPVHLTSAKAAQLIAA